MKTLLTHAQPLAVSSLFFAAALVIASLGACGETDDPVGGGAAGQGTGGTSAAADCASPGTPTTRTPTCAGTDTTCNVVPLACTRTAAKLACELGTASSFSATVSGNVRTLKANGIASHDVGDFPNPGNPHSIAPQTYTYEVPVTPSGAGAPTVIFGILTSGVVLDPGTAETWNDDTDWRYEALRYTTGLPYFSGANATDKTHHPDALGVDCNLAHVQPSGAYHYHGVPTSLVPATPAVTLAGWAADGYPIVLLYGQSDPLDASSAPREMVASYQLKSGARPAGGPGGTYDGTFGADWEYVAGSGDLDACNGHEGTVLIDGAPVRTYHYVLTNTFPYIPRCTTAAPSTSFTDRGGAPMGGGGGAGGNGAGGMTGAPPACAPGQVDHCCGDGTCDGPENTASCAADCP